MIDISNQKVEVNCSSCNRSMFVSLKQVANQVTISCPCGTRIKLEDKDRRAKRSIREVNKAFSDLGKTLKGFGK